MARNVFECMGRSIGNGIYCAHQQMNVDDNNNYEFISCEGCNGGLDEYHLYPEHNSDGSIIYQNEQLIDDRAPIWESVGMNNNGLTYTSDNRHDHIHPSYHTIDYNMPSTTGDIIPPTEVATIFGKNELTLVVDRWRETKYIGIRNVDTCNDAVYGKYSKYHNIVISKSMKDYSQDIPGWIHVGNYIPKTNKKKLVAFKANHKDIYNYCDKFFNNKDIAHNVYQSILNALNGDYINIYKLIINNGISEDQARTFMEEVTTQSYKSIYSGNVNFLKQLKLYNSITYNDKINDEMKKVYKVRIINYLLNYPKLKYISVYSSSYKPDERYWFLYSMIMSAKKEGIIDVNKIPEFFTDLILEFKNHESEYIIFNHGYKFSELDEVAKSDLAEATRLGLMTPAGLYPAMEKVTDLIKVTTTAEKKYYNSFKNHLKVGKKWTVAELQSSWEMYKRAASSGNYSIYWTFIRNIISDEWIIMNNKIMKLSERSSDDTGLSQHRDFAYNIMDNFIDEYTLDLSESHMSSDWSFTRAKAKNVKIPMEKSSDENSYDVRYGSNWMILNKLDLFNENNSLTEIHDDEKIIYGTSIVNDNDSIKDYANGGGNEWDEE